MADKNFHLAIITPGKPLFSGNVQSFSAPGVMGAFQVLVNHAPMLSLVTVGEVKVLDPAGAESRFSTSGGVVEVRKNNVTFLAETAEPSGTIDVARAEAARDRAKERLTGKSDGLDIDRARLALQRALNRLRVAGR